MRDYSNVGAYDSEPCDVLVDLLNEHFPAEASPRLYPETAEDRIVAMCHEMLRKLGVEIESLLHSGQDGQDVINAWRTELRRAEAATLKLLIPWRDERRAANDRH